MKKAIRLICWCLCITALCAGLYAEDEMSKDEYKAQMTQEMQKYIEEAKNEFADMKKYFAEEKDNFGEINDEIIKLKEKYIGLMEKSVTAIENEDQGLIEKIETQKSKLSHEMNILSIRKDMKSEMDYLQKRAEEYPGNTDIKNGIFMMEKAYEDLIEAEKALYAANKKIEDVYKEKQRLQDLCEMYFLEAEKQKLMKKMGE